jgi:hypothetical protein
MIEQRLQQQLVKVVGHRFLHFFFVARRDVERFLLCLLRLDYLLHFVLGNSNLLDLLS